ncbi:hypothetical protein LC087_12410 [Bacillus carboniphilus]|uniref:Phage protein n=1 Tax=Bacillus carboniphilus TaxID=86663 RepID=A0ABY9JQQ8_9BACI|nr:hypothetical protein [Bacillus carboniphilus]WLR41667.1 hypothetical protein LC087_12410 [Bacillus carboniphilus]
MEQTQQQIDVNEILNVMSSRVAELTKENAILQAQLKHVMESKNENNEEQNESR